MAEIIITKLERDEFKVWTARVSANGTTIPVTRVFGSWGTVPDGEGRYQELPRDWCAALQKRVFPIENRERIEREKAERAAR